MEGCRRPDPSFEVQRSHSIALVSVAFPLSRLEATSKDPVDFRCLQHDSAHWTVLESPHEKETTSCNPLRVYRRQSNNTSHNTVDLLSFVLDGSLRLESCEAGPPQTDD